MTGRFTGDIGIALCVTRQLMFQNSLKYKPIKIDLIIYFVTSLFKANGLPYYFYLTKGLRPNCIFYLKPRLNDTSTFMLDEHVCNIIMQSLFFKFNFTTGIYGFIISVSYLFWNCGLARIQDKRKYSEIPTPHRSSISCNGTYKSLTRSQLDYILYGGSIFNLATQTSSLGLALDTFQTSPR